MIVSGARVTRLRVGSGHAKPCGHRHRGVERDRARHRPQLGEEGHALTVAARRPEKLTAADELREAGYDVQEVAGNMADEDTIKQVVAAHRDRFGRLDVLVNNAGVGVGEHETKRVDLQLAVNFRAIVLFYREAVALLREAAAEHRNALVVNTSSSRGSPASRGCRSTRPPRRP